MNNTLNMSALEGKTVFITGATGLIGRAVIDALQNHNKRGAEPIKILALVRSREKAERLWKNSDSNLRLVVSDICELKAENLGVDYVIHGASQTSSKAFVSSPVNTIFTALQGTKKILEFSAVNPVKGLVYLSSMEVYGSPETDEKIDEKHSTNLDTMQVRTCYPESKRMCENLCVSYASEYGVPAKVVRLTQTFGPGVQYNDGRVFAEFARCAIEGRNIVLNTKGETKRCYLYTEDAVTAILTVLLNGEVGKAYNAANENTYCSIYEMANLVADNFGGGKISVVVNAKDDVSSFGYAPTLKMNLSTEKLRKLGWSAETDLKQMFGLMIDDMKK